MWTWQHSGLDCDGGPESGLHYEVVETAMVVIGTNGDGTPIYARAADVVFSTLELFAFEAYEPGLNEVAITTVTAVDGAGNPDTDCPAQGGP